MTPAAAIADLGGAWESLLEAPLPPRLDLVQCQVEWISEPSFRALRAMLDRKIYRTLLEDRSALRVRRLVPYDVPRAAIATSADHRQLARAHKRWIAGLTRDLQNVDSDVRATNGAPAPYQLRQIIVGRAGTLAGLPADGFGLGADDAWAAAFERVWTDPARAIEDNRTGDVATTALRGDRNPLWHLWRD